MSEPSSPAAPQRARPARIGGRWALRLLLAVVGAALGILLLGRVHAPLGPFDATLALRPVGGGAQVDIPPLGSLDVDVYHGPLQLQIQLNRLDEGRARAIAADPQRLAASSRGSRTTCTPPSYGWPGRRRWPRSVAPPSSPSSPCAALGSR